MVALSQSTPWLCRCGICAFDELKLSCVCERERERETERETEREYENANAELGVGGLLIAEAVGLPSKKTIFIRRFK